MTFSLEHVLFKMANVLQEFEGKYGLSPIVEVKVILA